MDPNQVMSTPVKSSYKNKTRPIYRIGFYTVQVMLICISSLPTVFFIYHIHHPDHNSGTKHRTTTPPPALDGNTSTNSSKVLCNTPLVYNNKTMECYAPCGWTTMSIRAHRVYYALMAVGLWLPLFATIFILITWSKIKTLRKFPHVIRFYIIVTCILLACCKMVPLRVGLQKTFCSATDKWSPTGITSLTNTIQGASCHYLTLCLSFWATCFIFNTYVVVVRGTRKLFESSTLIHIIQSIICWVGPAIIVVICVYVKYPSPAYKIVFVDFMSASPCGEIMKYLAVTLPMQIALGMSLCFLWSITWCIRRSRKDNTRHAIRADKDTQAMLRIERQFMVMTVMILLTVGVMLSVITTKDYQLERLILLAQSYFHCLKSSDHDRCQPPDLLTPLYAVIIIAPGFLCMLFFFLLFMNKDCREIWKSCFRGINQIKEVARPRLDTSRSRCSSTLTVLGTADRRLSDIILRKDRIKQLRSSSTPDLVCVGRPSPLEVRKKTLISPLALESRQRSSSTPVQFLIERRDSPEVSRVTSMPGDIVQNKHLNSPQRFKIEINIVNDSDCISSTDQKDLAQSHNRNSSQFEGEYKGTFTEMLNDPNSCTTSL